MPSVDGAELLTGIKTGGANAPFNILAPQGNRLSKPSGKRHRRVSNGKRDKEGSRNCGKRQGATASMQDWNLIVTVRPGPEHVHRLLTRLGQLGHFARTSFKDVLVGRVDDVQSFLDAVLEAKAADKAWATLIGRIIPAESIFTFTPDTLVARLKDAVAPLVERMSAGTFHFRLERRGMAQRIPSQEIERAVAEHVFALAEACGIALSTRFEDPDYIIAAETIGDQCGVALIPRGQSARYPFVRTR
jgi:tRNA(Ser,Leu) C12 N-acetylase TAN1